MKRAIAFVVFATGVLLAGCNIPAEGAAIFLTQGSAKQRLACEGAFGSDGADPSEDTDGSKWVWHFSANGASDQWCRKDRSGELSAWAQVVSAEAATHKLAFNEGDQPAVFQPQPSR